MVEPSFISAANAFRGFFTELNKVFLERETLLTQVQLALLCREHVLIVGPPGTAKSALASAVLSRIVDERTQQPSLFAKQLSESTVQSDLIGPVDFKVLTETGRTEYLTDEGMLGATHAFLDEVFDGRDMLLRSILNVLHERELKHGKKITAGRCECALMTSNRYLSEVLARSPELLLAFADRLSFVCFCPKGFARASSRTAMLDRAVGSQRPALEAGLTLQQLDVLQHEVERVEVPGAVTEAIEALADGLERALLERAAKLPDYVPTKYFSQRSIVKALWALKAAVVLDAIHRSPGRERAARLEDLGALSHFFLLGGPLVADAEALMKAAADPRERAQLEIVRAEALAFDEVLANVLSQLKGGAGREAEALHVDADLRAAQALVRSFEPAAAAPLAHRLRDKLSPGPRYPGHRPPLVAAAHTLMRAIERPLRDPPPTGERLAPMVDVAGAALLLVGAAPELAELQAPLAARLVEWATAAFRSVSAGLEAGLFERRVTLDQLIVEGARARSELSRVVELVHQLGASAALDQAEQDARARAAAALREQAVRVLARLQADVEAIGALSRSASALEEALCALDPKHRPGRGARRSGCSRSPALISRSCCRASAPSATPFAGRGWPWSRRSGRWRWASTRR